MRDPKPENIAGKKSVSHSVEHSVDWGILAGAFAVLFLVWYFDPLGRLNSEGDDEEGGGLG